MKKDVIIKFHGLNSVDGASADKTEFMTTGCFYEKNSKYYLQYEEITEEDPEVTNTTLKIDGSKVTVLRHGKNNTQLVVEKGKKHLCLYDTPYGAISIGIVAKDVFVDIGEHAGKIKLYYGVEYNNVLTGRNKLDLSFEEVAKSE